MCRCAASIVLLAAAGLAQWPHQALAAGVPAAPRTAPGRTGGSGGVSPSIGRNTRVRSASTGPGYVTILFGRTMYSIADASCNVLPGSVPLDQVAQDLASRGLKATAVVVVDRTQPTNRLCYGGSLYASWSDLASLSSTYGWSFDSDGMTHNDITTMTTTQQYQESCDSLGYLAQHGFTSANAFYAYGDNKRTTAIQTNIVSKCFDYGRTYNGGVNSRSTLSSPWFQVTNSLLGGACSDSTQSCYHLNVNGKRYASPVAISNLLQVTGDQWVVVQFYRMVSGASLNTTPSWDCTSPNWQDHWTSQTEMYCINDFDQAISTIPPGTVVADPATVAAAWGRQVSDVAGEVTAQGTGKGIAGATVSWSGGTTTTDPSGYYTLGSVAPGEETVSVTSPGNPPASAGVDVIAGITTVQNFSLGTATTGTIAGVVRDAGDGDPLSGASVTCTCSDVAVTTGSDGTYAFLNITPADGYSMDFSDADYTPETVNGVDVSAGQTTTENAQLSGLPGMIEGDVSDAGTEMGIPGATVTCTCSGADAVTDGSGAYSFSNVAPGKYGMSFAADGYATEAVSGVVVAPDGTTTENATLAAGGTIAGDVSDGTAIGNPAIPGAVVTCTCASGSVTTDASGSYTFADVAVGNYDLAFSATGFVSQTVTGVSVSPGSTTIQNVLLIEDGAISGTVTDATTGAPIAGAHVTCTCSTGSTATDGTGTYTLTAVAPGIYAVSVSMTGYATASNSEVVVQSGTTTVEDFALTATGHTPVFSDGFESGNLSAWTSSKGLTIEGTLVHSGAFAAGANTTNGATDARKDLPSTYSTGYGRVWFDVVSQSSTVNVIRFDNSSSSPITYLDVTPAHLLAMTAGGTTITSMTTVSPGVFHELELSVTVHGTSSTTEVWLDGAVVTSLSRTLTLSAPLIAQLQIGQVMTGGTYDVAFDDAAFDTQYIP